MLNFSHICCLLHAQFYWFLEFRLIKGNGREGLSNFDPSIYEGEVVVGASTEGNPK